MNILVMTLYWYPYEGPIIPVYGAIFKDLVQRGNKVTIITSFPHYRKGRRETWNEYRGKICETSQWEGVKLLRSYVYAPVFDQRKSGLLYRGLNFLSFNLSSLFTALLLAGKPDVIFASSSPPLTNGMIAWMVSLLKRCPLIYNVQDIFPDIAEKTGAVRNRVALAVLKAIEVFVYTVADKVLLLSEGMRRNVIAKGVLRRKTEVIPNFLDTDFLKPSDQDNPFSREWNLAGRFVAMYAGSVGISHGAEVIVEAAEILGNQKGIVFCFVGGGEYKPNLEEMASRKELNNVVFIPAQPFTRMNHVLPSAAVSLITYKKGLAEDSLPTKLVASMCSGCAVVAAIDEDSDTGSVIKEAGCGIIVPPEDSKALAEAILTFCQQSEKAEEMGRRGRAYVLEHFRSDVVIGRYEELFKSVLS
jgi:colanic acid biosynthesis glycosyl transferase WcaI